MMLMSVGLLLGAWLPSNVLGAAFKASHGSAECQLTKELFVSYRIFNPAAEMSEG